MKSYFVFALFLSLLINFKGSGQKRNNVWIFGDHSGLNFNTIPPSPMGSTPVNTLASDTLASDFVSSICDTVGNLVFYSDGKQVWNRLHKKMLVQGVQWP